MKTAAARSGFTILEMLVAVALFMAILGVVFSVLDHSIRVWRQTNSRIDAFQTAKAAFEMVTNRLSQATLNTYWDYYDNSGNAYRRTSTPATFVPLKYGRYSDMQFVSGQATALILKLPPNQNAVATHGTFFCAPTGLTATSGLESMSGLLSACGYFVAFGSDQSTRPAVIDSPLVYRWRLMELSSPTESLEIHGKSGTSWFTEAIGRGDVRPVADNVVAFIAWPRLPQESDPEGDEIAPNYSYDSRTGLPWTGSPPRQPIQAHQLPPVMQITMAVIDEPSAIRIESGTNSPKILNDALDGLFDQSVLDYKDDLGTLEKRLMDAKITYRIFSSGVALRESRWSP